MNYTPEQRRAIETLGRHLSVDAGAGSGKTRVLIDRVVRLIEFGEATLDEIVAITFTEKAAAEMKDRLRRACREQAPPGPGTTPAQMNHWRTVERQVDESRIMTIHAFCAGLMREHALALGIDPDFRLLEEAESGLLRRRVAYDCLEREVTQSETAMRCAVAFGFGGMTDIIARLLAQRVDLSASLREYQGCDAAALAAQWRKRVDAEHNARLVDFSQSRRARSCREALARYEGDCTKPSDRREQMRVEMIARLDTIMSSELPGEIEVELRAITALNAKGSRRTNWVEAARLDTLEKIQKKLIENAKAHMPLDIDPETELESAQLTLDLIAAYDTVYTAYENEKRALHCMDFDDLIRGGLHILEHDQDLRARTASGIRHLLIDEFQDTDRDQLAIARLLQRSAERNGAQLFIVGDAKQSIYNFRGAEVGVFLEANAEADDVIPLAKNFRSLPNVLHFVNTFFATASYESGGVVFDALEAHRDEANGPRIEFLVPELEEKANAETARRAEARLIANRIHAMCNGGEEVADPASHKTRPAQYGDVAILFRSAGEVYLYEEQLRRCEIPYYVVTGGGFYDRQEVRDVSNLLKAVSDRENEMALLGYLRGPLAALTDEAILQIRAAGQLRHAFWNAPPLRDAEQQARLEHARATLRRLSKRLGLPLREFLETAMRETAIEAILLAGPHGAQRVGNVRKIVDLAGKFQTLGAPALPEFLRYLDNAAAREFKEGDAPLFAGSDGAVTLMTIHKSKGLEFPIVCVADLGRGQNRGSDNNGIRLHKRLGFAAPVTDSDGERAYASIAKAIDQAAKREDDAESARILYVAMTRARDWLLLGCSPGRGENWSAVFDELYGFNDAPDGKPVTGDNWQGVVRRSVPDPKRPTKPASTKQTHEPSRDWSTQIAPIAQANPRIVPVSMLLDRIDEQTQASEVRHHAHSEIDPLLRGSVVHEYLRAWDFASNAPPAIDAFLMRACAQRLLRPKLADDLHTIADRFQKSEMFNRLRTAETLQRERDFLLKLGNNFISGAIDLLMDDTTMLDYKTGQPGGVHAPRYELQLALYAAAMERITGHVPSEGLVYYVDTGDTVAINLNRDTIDQAIHRATHALG